MISVAISLVRHANMAVKAANIKLPEGIIPDGMGRC